MAETQMPTQKRLRDLIVDFYSKHNPEKLRLGLDVNGIVMWTQRNGIDALNEVLRDQCGQTLDLKTNLGTGKKKAQRISTAFQRRGSESNSLEKDVLNEERQKIMLRLQYFYEKHDPDKLGSIFKLSRFVLYHGEIPLNKKLLQKYGEALPTKLPDDYGPKRLRKSVPSFGPPATPPPLKGPPIYSPRAGKHFDYSGNSSTTNEKTSYRSDEEIEEELRCFFKVHDPEKLDGLQILVDLVKDIGRDEVNRKLDQLYGEDLDMIVDKSKYAVSREDEPPMPPPKTPRMGSPPKATAAHGSSRKLKNNKPEFSKSPSDIRKSWKKKVGSNTNSNGSFTPSPVSYTHSSPSSKRPGISPVQKTISRTSRSFKSKSASQQPQGVSPMEGPCSVYRLDMMGDSFGICVCGFAKEEHSASARLKRPKQSENIKNIQKTFDRSNKSTSTTNSVNAKGNWKTHPGVRTKKIVSVRLGGKPIGKPCGNYKLDIYGINYGDCVCGYAKTIHNFDTSSKHKSQASNTGRAKKRYQATLEKSKSQRNRVRPLSPKPKSGQDSPVNGASPLFGWQPKRKTSKELSTASSNASASPHTNKPYIPNSPDQSYVPKATQVHYEVPGAPITVQKFQWKAPVNNEYTSPKNVDKKRKKRKKKRSLAINFRSVFKGNKSKTKCTSCGTKVAHKAKFCHNCGTKT